MRTQTWVWAAFVAVTVEFSRSWLGWQCNSQSVYCRFIYLLFFVRHRWFSWKQKKRVRKSRGRGQGSAALSHNGRCCFINSFGTIKRKKNACRRHLSPVASLLRPVPPGAAGVRRPAKFGRLDEKTASANSIGSFTASSVLLRSRRRRPTKEETREPLLVSR